MGRPGEAMGALQLIERRVEELSAGSLVALVLAGVVAPLAATFVVAGALDAVMVGVACAWGAGGVWAWRTRAVAAELPLELAGAAFSGRVNGVRVYRFRVRLGHGRAMHGPVAAVTFRPEVGAPVELAVAAAPSDILVGPWIVVASDPDGVCDAPGAFDLAVRATERGRLWEAAGIWRREALVDGRFGAGMARVGGRLRWDDTTWDQAAEGAA
jgi:hypothetical protein